MSKHVVLVNFTDKGLSAAGQSPARAEAFRDAAAKNGVTVETVLWTSGPYDGLVILNAPDEVTAAATVLKLVRGGNVKTCMLRAYDAEEFASVVAKMGS